MPKSRQTKVSHLVLLLLVQRRTQRGFYHFNTMQLSVRTFFSLHIAVCCDSASSTIFYISRIIFSVNRVATGATHQLATVDCSVVGPLVTTALHRVWQTPQGLQLQFLDSSQILASKCQVTNADTQCLTTICNLC